MKTPSTNKPRAPRLPKLSEDDYVYCMMTDAVSPGGVFFPDHRKSGLVVTRLNRGERLTTEQMADFPREFVFNAPKRAKPPEIFCWTTGPHIVCSQFREWLEEMEPGRITFHPISVRPLKGIGDHWTYYLILRPPVVDAIIPEGTIFFGGGADQARLIPTEASLCRR